MSDTETEMTPEPDWLAAHPTARAKLTAIFAALRRCYVECPGRDSERWSGPHVSAVMAEVFIGQLLMKAAGDHGDLTPAEAYMEGVKAERQRIRELAAGDDARYFSDGHSHAFADLLRGDGDD